MQAPNATENVLQWRDMDFPMSDLPMCGKCLKNIYNLTSRTAHKQSMVLICLHRMGKQTVAQWSVQHCPVPQQCSKRESAVQDVPILTLVWSLIPCLVPWSPLKSLKCATLMASITIRDSHGCSAGMRAWHALVRWDHLVAHLYRMHVADEYLPVFFQHGHVCCAQSNGCEDANSDSSSELADASAVASSSSSRDSGETRSGRKRGRRKNKERLNRRQKSSSRPR